MRMTHKQEKVQYNMLELLHLLQISYVLLALSCFSSMELKPSFSSCIDRGQA